MPPRPELDMDWIHPWIGLDWIGLGWIGSGFLGNFVDWIGLGPMTAILCFFFHLYIFYITTGKRCRCNSIMCILADFNRL